MSWLRHEYRLLAYGVLAVCLALMMVLPLAFTLEGGWRLVQLRDLDRDQIERMWRAGIRGVAGVQLLLMMLLAADLGTAALSDDRNRDELHFLATRPRSRRYFAWSGWAAGVTQLLTIATLAVLAATAVLRVPEGSVRVAPLLAALLAVWLLGALVFGAAYALALATGNPRHAYSLTVALVLAWVVSEIVVAVAMPGFYWSAARAWRAHSAVPLWSMLAWAHDGSRSFPTVSLLIVSGAGLLMPALAARAFERREL